LFEASAPIGWRVRLKQAGNRFRSSDLEPLFVFRPACSRFVASPYPPNPSLELGMESPGDVVETAKT
jgi:hypothetical protein